MIDRLVSTLCGMLSDYDETNYLDSFFFSPVWPKGQDLDDPNGPWHFSISDTAWRSASENHVTEDLVKDIFLVVSSISFLELFHIC